jgi:N-acetylglucosamine-6-phosphate deacetylase
MMKGLVLSRMTQTLTARRLITHEAAIEFPVLTVEDGCITEIASDPASLRDATDTLTAGFFDIHTHGGMGHDVMSASRAELGELQRFLASRGVANYLPTTVTAGVDETLRALSALADLIESETPAKEAAPIGIHLEGPFLSCAKRGVHAPEKLQPPSVELFERFHAAARGHIKLVTIAPEPGAIPGSGSSSALDLIRYACGLGVRVSLGHSNATAEETIAAIAAGATSATHTFNAMRALDHREPGILGTVLTDDRLFAELICDGIHVTPALVRLWLRAKGLQHAILVTDSMSATGMGDGEYTLADQPVTVANGRAVLAESPGTLAGSILTMDAAVANVQAFTGVGLGDAMRLASHNPAAMLGVDGLTAVGVGRQANLNRFDGEGRLVGSYLRGELVG